VSTACASGAHSIGDAFRFIKDGYADMMVCGGTEASINSLSIAGFSRCMALSTKWNDEPSKASRPFDQKRDGFVIAEGAGILVLEEYESAKKRIGEEGIYAEILGYGLSGDAYHLTAPDPNASGAIRAMKGALRNFDPRKVDYVNAHATSTPLGDQLEARAISQVFNESSSVSVSSTKGSTGHLLGAAGALEAIFTILSVKHDILPHTLNLHSLDLEVETLPNLAFIRDQPEQKLINSALSNSFGFGGTNASLSFGKLCKNNAV
jgi:3-oxoacyl-[acyl-carrier-protein] synthase II